MRPKRIGTEIWKVAVPLLIFLPLILCQSPHSSGRSRAADDNNNNYNDNNNNGAFRINSPRQQQQQDEQEQQQQQDDRDGVKLVKLPPDLEAVLNLQKSDRSRHASILGLPSGGLEEANLDKILSEDGSTTAAYPGLATSPAFAPQPSTSTTRATSTTTERVRPTTTRRKEEEDQRGRNIYDSDRSAARQPQQGADENRDPTPNKEQLPARSVWSIVWEAHIYFSGTLFVLLAIYCTVNILRLHTFSRLFSRGYFVALNLCIIILSILRPIYLFHDPYNAGESLPRVLAYLLLGTGFPCISTGFAVLFLALLRATQIELVSPSFQTPRSLGIFCGLHFLISMVIDIVIGLQPKVRYTILICQGFFIVWSLLLSAGYFYIFSAMKKIAMRSHNDMMRSVYPKLMIEGGQQPGTFGGVASNGHIPIPGGGGASYAMDPRYSTMNGQLVMDPRYASLAATGMGGTNGPMIPQASGMPRPPLARAVHLTLGVAVLGSLMGGVQLFGMIKMLGLQKMDMSNHHNEWAWYGYQVAMRILEVTICTLLAVIATTPLRSDPTSNLSNPSSSNSPRFNAKKWYHSLCCCLRSLNPPREFEDEIYSEICTNNHTVRQMNHNAANMLQNATNEQQLMAMNNPYGTLVGRNGIHNGDHMMMPMGTLVNPDTPVLTGQHHHHHQLMMMQQQQQQGQFPHNSKRPGSTGSSNPNSTLRASSAGAGQMYHDGNVVPRAASSMASSRATIDTALYTNLRGGVPGERGGPSSNGNSRPSSMLFNDSGFVRFRMGTDPNLQAEEILKRSTHNLADEDDLDRDQQQLQRNSRMEDGLRASQSFDESVLLMDAPSNGQFSPGTEQPPGSSFAPRSSGGKGNKLPSANKKRNSDQLGQLHRQSPIYKSIDSLHSEEDRRRRLSEDVGGSGGDNSSSGQFYEAPPGMKLPPPAASSSSANQAGGGYGRRGSNNIYSESDMSSVYGRVQGTGIYASRAPSRCSSISATQSFDMRMYGRTGPNGAGSAGPPPPPPLRNNNEGILPEKPTGTPSSYASATLRKNEETKEKLENPYYYYGSTRNQKKTAGQKPRPLLPSQRQQLDLQDRGPSPLQLQLQQKKQLQHQQSQPQPLPAGFGTPQFQRSRSLGGYYNKNAVQGPPLRNQQYHPQQAAGSMTPVSYSRWQHAQETEQKPKRYNPLYDTPPTARHNPPRPPLRAGGEIRGLVGGANAQSRQKPPPSQLLPYPPQPRFKQQEQQLLSPILTDHEMSPMHQVNKKQRQQQQQQSRRGNDNFSDSNTDYEESDVNSTFERYPSQATQGYADGLADNESEASSMFGTNGNKDPLSHQLPHNKQNKKLHLVSPLEYSAMLKLYNSGGDQAGSGDHSSSSHPQAAISGNQRPHHPQSQGSKDITPDSGVAMGNNTDSNKSNKKESSRQSLISSSSSLNDLLGSSRVLPNNSSSTKESGFRKPSGVGHGKKDYSRVNTRESMVNPRRNNTVFSSSSEESESDAEEMLKNLPQSSFQGGLGKQEKRYHPLVSPPSSESNYPAFRWDGSKVVNSSSNEPSPREGREEGKTRCPPQPMPRTSSSSRRPSAGEDFSESYTEEDGLDDEDEEEEEEVLEVCKEIQNADFNNAQSDSKIVSEQKI